MKSTVFAFWLDESGFIVSAELVLIATILVLGLIVGMSSIQNAIVFEMNNIGWAFSSLNQSFFIPGFFGCKGAFSSGSAFFNQNLNGACFVLNTGGVGAIGPGFVGGGVGGYGYGGYGGYSDATFGIGPAPRVAPAKVMAPSVCPTDCPAGTSTTAGDCPSGSTVIPGSTPAPGSTGASGAVAPGSTMLPGSTTTPSYPAPSTGGQAPFHGAAGIPDYSPEIAPPRPSPY